MGSCEKRSVDVLRDDRRTGSSISVRICWTDKGREDFVVLVALFVARGSSGSPAGVDIVWKADLGLPSRALFSCSSRASRSEVVWTCWRA